MRVLVSLLLCFVPFITFANEESDALRFVKNLYNNYQKNFVSMSIVGPNADTIYCPELLKIARLDKERSHGENGFLDWDPLCDCQDPEDMKIDKLKVNHRSDGIFVDIQFTLSETKMLLTLKLKKNKEKWLICDISSPTTPSLFEYLMDNLKINPVDVKLRTFEKFVVVVKSYANKSTIDIAVLKQKREKKFTEKMTDTVFSLTDQENGFFLNLFKTFLFMDYGTGPDARTLHVYDIVSGKKVLDTLYSDAIRAIGNDTVSIWLESGDTAVSKCPEYRKWTEHGLGAAIISEHYFDLDKLKLYPTTNWKCEARQ